jgi:hypothetical protein
MDLKTLQALHNGCVIWMTSLIWVVQLIIYPSFRNIEESGFKNFHQRYSAIIAFLVAPMLAQFVLAWALVISQSNNQELLIQAGLISAIFVVTYWFSVPEHRILGKTKDLDAINRLIRTNWMRTLLWTVQCYPIIQGAIHSTAK